MSLDNHRNANGTYNGVGVMSEMTGLTRETVTQIWQRVKVNQAKLDACPLHDFAPAEPATAVKPAGRQRVCRNCGGELETHAVGWYERGLAHSAAAK